MKRVFWIGILTLLAVLNCSCEQEKQRIKEIEYTHKNIEENIINLNELKYGSPIGNGSNNQDINQLINLQKNN